MAYEKLENARDNFGKFIHQLQPETKILIRKLERTLKLYWQNVSLLFNQTYIYIYRQRERETERERERETEWYEIISFGSIFFIFLKKNVPQSWFTM